MEAVSAAAGGRICSDRVEKFFACIGRRCAGSAPTTRSWRENGGDAVTDRLPVAVGKRHVDWKIDTWTRIICRSECIAVQIDNARQDKETVRVDAERVAAVIRR